MAELNIGTRRNSSTVLLLVLSQTILSYKDYLALWADSDLS